MNSERIKDLNPGEKRDTVGGLGYAHLSAATSLVDYSWLKNAAAKLRANLQVLPPVGPVAGGVAMRIRTGRTSENPRRRRAGGVRRSCGSPCG